MKTSLHPQRGVSLVEALVAFGVMAFGMLAVVGMQSTLRTNGDLARQRAEAVRIAQDSMEEWRSFSIIDQDPSAASPTRAAYSDIQTVQATEIAPSGSNNANTTFTLTRRATPEPTVTDTFPAGRKAVSVDVSWADRTGRPQLVRLASSIVVAEPMLEASLVMGANADPVLQPRGRYRGIPARAVSFGDGTSGFVPPGQASSGVVPVWVFNNTTGLIRLCSTTASYNVATTLTASVVNAAGCTGTALLVSGVLRNDITAPPTSTSVVNPGGSVPDLGISIVTSPASTPAPACFSDTSGSDNIAYFCAVPITSAAPTWTGSIRFTSTQVATAASTAPSWASQYRVCSYPGVAISATDRNADNVGVSAALLNQNFVFIRAGSVTSAYGCPTPTVATFQPG